MDGKDEGKEEYLEVEKEEEDSGKARDAPKKGGSEHKSKKGGGKKAAVPARQPVKGPGKSPKGNTDGAAGEKKEDMKAEAAVPESGDRGHARKASIKEYMETDVDKLYELARDKGIIKVKDAAKTLGIDSEQVEEWGRILEEHKLVRLRYPPVGEPVIILKKFTTDSEKIKELKAKKKLRPAKRIFIVNLVVLLSFAAFVAFYFIRFRTVRITYSQAYLAAAAIVIIGIVLVVRFIWKRRKNEKGAGQAAAKETGKGGQK